VAPPALTAAALAEGVDATDTGVVRLFERVRDIPFSFAAHRTGLSRPAVERLDCWLDTLPAGATAAAR
jgi:hypothetical protein